MNNQPLIGTQCPCLIPVYVVPMPVSEPSLQSDPFSQGLSSPVKPSQAQSNHAPRATPEVTKRR